MNRYVSFLLLSALVGPAAAAAQDSPPTPVRGGFSLGLRLGPAVPTGQFREDGVRDGFGYGLEAILHPSPVVAMYAGFGTAGYPPSDPLEFLYDDTTIDVMGLEAGFRVSPLPSLPLSPWVGVGLVYKEIWVEGGGFIFGENNQTHHSFGWELAGGAGYAMTRRVHITPAVRFQRLSPREEIDSWSVTDANQLLMDVGIAYRF